jgi:hypothetical protein
VTQTVESSATPETDRGALPRQIAYIIGNEGCERFSFYGMRNILTQFLVASPLLAAASASQSIREAAAKEVFHTFVLGVEQQGRFFHRPVPHRAWLGGDQAVRFRVRRRPVRPIEQVARQGRI